MQFRWLSPGSDKAAAAMVVARMNCKGMSRGAAIHETLNNGLLCRFPGEMPEREATRFQMMIEDTINKSTKRRQENESNQITSPGA